MIKSAQYRLAMSWWFIWRMFLNQYDHYSIKILATQGLSFHIQMSHVSPTSAFQRTVNPPQTFSTRKITASLHFSKHQRPAAATAVACTSLFWNSEQSLCRWSVPQKSRARVALRLLMMDAAAAPPHYFTRSLVDGCPIEIHYPFPHCRCCGMPAADQPIVCSWQGAWTGWQMPGPELLSRAGVDRRAWAGWIRAPGLAVGEDHKPRLQPVRETLTRGEMCQAWQNSHTIALTQTHTHTHTRVRAYTPAHAQTHKHTDACVHARLL